MVSRQQGMVATHNFRRISELLCRHVWQEAVEMRLLVTGVKGQLGHDIIRVCQTENIEAIRVDIEEMDKSQLEQTGFDRLPSWQDALKCYLVELDNYY